MFTTNLRGDRIIVMDINNYLDKTKNRKQIKIDLLGPPCGEINLIGYEYPRLYPTEYKHIYLDHEITEEEFENCINTLVTYFMQNGLYGMLIDLDKKNKKLSPVKEMTIEEIEDKLGYKIKIIKGEE